MDAVADPLRTLVPFVSRLQLERIRCRGGQQASAPPESFDGALLFLDVAGFSTVTERLREEGPRGAERLSGILGAYFRPVLRTIRAHGGDVLFFAGDAMAVVWKAGPGLQGLTEATVRAAQCALEVQQCIATVEPQFGVELRFRASIGAGTLEVLEVGGAGGHWMQMVRGRALVSACRSYHTAPPGAVTLTADSPHTVRGALATEALADGCLRIASLKARVEPQPLPDANIDDARALALEPLAQMVQDHADADGSFVAEFRQVTVVFLNISHSSEAPEAATLQRAVHIAQQHAERFEGVIYELLEDDKGTSLIAAFGLPGTSHSDDAVRALLAATGMQRELSTLGLTPTAGVATGPLYCGPHGDEHRRHYAVIGATINLAARMMTLADERGILCDTPTRKLAQQRIGFAEAGWTTPKGFLAPVALFQPTGESDAPLAAHDEQLVVGRAREIGIISQAMNRLMADPRSRVVVMRAEPGMGKSTLLNETRRLARERSVQFSLGAGDSLETGTTYFAFRRLAREWFEVPANADVALTLQLVTATFSDAPTLQPLVALLGRVLGYDFADNARTQQMRGQARAEAVRDMLLHAATRRSAGRPMVIAIEDAHWLDAASWSLVRELVENVPGLLLVLATRPITTLLQDFSDLLAREGTELIELEAFGRAETEAALRAQLGVSEIAPAVLDLVTRRAEGNPFFTREIVRSLQESGGIRIRADRVELVLEEGAAVPLPATLEGVITSRIDRLSRGARTTIKVAAVLGRSFDPELLLAIHPARPDRDALGSELEELRGAALLTVDESGHGLAFNHALTHEAAYNLLSFSQRESLHRDTAEQMERIHAGNLDPVRSRLGYHFRMAQLPDRAVPHLAAAGEAAVDAYASRDALEFLTSALTLDERVRGPLDIDLQRARWCRLIGQALYNQDRQAEAGEYYRRAIKLAGAYPKRKVAGAAGIVLRALLTPGHVAVVSKSTPPPEVRARLIEGLAAARELAAVYMWENEQVKFAASALSAAAVTRTVGPSEESAEAFSMLAFLLSIMGFRRAGTRIGYEAVKIAEAVGDIRQMVATSTICGMQETQNGRPFEGLALLQRADQAATALRSGLHRHRPKYMLADTLLRLGRYSEARSLFQHSAELSRGAEQHVMGLANAMVALTLIREGRPEAAISILQSPDGVPSVLQGEVVASVIIALGVLAEARLDLGDNAAALEVVREAESWLTPKDQATAYFATIFGHSAMARVRLATGDYGEPVRRGLRRRTLLDMTIARMRVLRQRFPAALGPLSLISGQLAAARGHNRNAVHSFKRAIAASKAASQPYELGRSLVELGRLLPEPRRAELVDQAIRIFDAHGMTLESGRARSLLNQH